MVNRKKKHELMREGLNEVRMQDEKVIAKYKEKQREIVVLEAEIIELKAMLSKYKELQQELKDLENEKAEYDERKFMEYEGKRVLEEGLLTL